MDRKGAIKLLSENLVYYILAVIVFILLILLIYTKGKMFLP